MPSAFEHGPSLTVPASNTTAKAAVIWSAASNLGESTIILDSGGNGRIGIAGDLDVITITSGTVTVAGIVAATTLTGAGSGITALNGTQVTSGTLPAARIGDDSIVEAKLDVSNGPTDGYFLQAQSGEGGGLTWAAAGGGGLVFIDTAVASASSTLEVTLTGSYETYLITGSDLKPGNDVVELRGNFGASGSWTTSGYLNAFHRVRSDAVHDMATSLTSAIQMGSTTGSATGEGAGFAIWFTRPIGTADVYPSVQGNMLAVNHSTIIEAGHISSFVSSDIDIARFKIAFSAGTIASGRLTVWGLVHA